LVSLATSRHWLARLRNASASDFTYVKRTNLGYVPRRGASAVAMWTTNPIVTAVGKDRAARSTLMSALGRRRTLTEPTVKVALHDAPSSFLTDVSSAGGQHRHVRSVAQVAEA